MAYREKKRERWRKRDPFGRERERLFPYRCMETSMKTKGFFP